MNKQLELELQSTYWYNPEFISLPKYTLFRAFLKDLEKRIYYVIENNDPEFYLGATSATGLYYPKGKSFEEWYRNHPNPDQYVKERKEIGSAEHILFPLFLKLGKISYAFVHGYVSQMIECGYAISPDKDNEKRGNHLQYLSKDKTANEVYKAILSFAQFLVDYKVQPIACEIGLKSDKIGIGTYSDFICKMTIEEKGFWGEVYAKGGKNNAKGTPKETLKAREVIALIDFKSGTWDGEEHDGQLWLNKLIWEENYPAIPIEMLFNWHPKNFRDKPTYQLLEKPFDPAEVELIWKKAKLKKDKFINQEVISEFDETIEAGVEPKGIKYISLRDQIIISHKDFYTEKEPILAL